MSDYLLPLKDEFCRLEKTVYKGLWNMHGGIACSVHPTLVQIRMSLDKYHVGFKLAVDIEAKFSMCI